MWRVTHYLIDQGLLDLNQILNFPSDTFNWNLFPSLCGKAGDWIPWSTKKMLICVFKWKLQWISTKVSEFGFEGPVWKDIKMYFLAYRLFIDF